MHGFDQRAGGGVRTTCGGKLASIHRRLGGETAFASSHRAVDVDFVPMLKPASPGQTRRTMAASKAIRGATRMWDLMGRTQAQARQIDAAVSQYDIRVFEPSSIRTRLRESRSKAWEGRVHTTMARARERGCWLAHTGCAMSAPSSWRP